MAGAEVGRGLLSGVITATAEGTDTAQGSEWAALPQLHAKGFHITAL